MAVPLALEAKGTVGLAPERMLCHGGNAGVGESAASAMEVDLGPVPDAIGPDRPAQLAFGGGFVEPAVETT